MRNEIKPCVFCGSKNLYINDPGFINCMISVICNDCGATGPLEASDMMAVRSWNKEKDE